MSNGKRKVRPLPWLKTRSQPALCNEHRKELVGFASRLTPSSAYETARERMYLETEDMTLSEEVAKACRFLAMIRRDHGKEAFEMVVSSGTEKGPRPISTDKKGAKAMSKKLVKQKRQRRTKKAKKATKAPSIPLQHINYRSAVNATFARVKCTQYFKNDTQNPVEAIYVFPIPDEATVTACTMRIGKRKIEAELKKRKEARKEYEEAIEQGHYASLLEQERPNIFTMNVGGIEPGEKIRVEVDYVQRVSWQAGGGRFTIPLVVAPRFIPGTTPVGRQASGWSPDTDQVPDASRITPVVAKEGVSYDADISVMFSPGFRCKLSSPSHSSIIKEQEVKKTVTIELKIGDIRTDRDFILVYKSLSKIPEVATHRGEFNGESFMLASIIPPGDVTAVGSDIVLVLDCSGSMHGAKIDGLKVIAKKIIRNLKKQNVEHHIGIVPFDDNYWPTHPISEINESTEKFIDGLRDRGGTMLGPALSLAHQQFGDTGRPRVVLLVTDGQTESLNYTGTGIRIITIGIGSAVNDTVIKDLANKTGGVHELVYPGEDYDAVANRMTGYISGPVLSDVKVQAKGDIVGICDVFKGRPATIAVRFKGKLGKVEISGKDPDSKKLSWQLNPSDANECDFAAQVWARDHIRESQDEQQQTEVSLKYSVICRYTSFVAVFLKEVPGKRPERVEIPVNLPVGWDYEAVFGAPVAMKAMRATAPVAALPAELYESAGEEEPVAMTADFDEDIRFEATVPPASTPPVPPITPPQGITPIRFTLDAKDIVDRMIGILIALSKGRRDEAEKAFAGVKRELTVKKVKQLNNYTVAMLYYFALRLRSYGFRLDENVMAKLSVKPRTSDSDAQTWYNLALKEEGRNYSVVGTSILFEAKEYVNWKFGKAERPESSEWSLVP